MSDALTDGARMMREAEAYSKYLEALQDCLEWKTKDSFGYFMSRAAETPERLRGWGGNRLNLTDAEGSAYLGKLASGDKEVWASLLWMAQLEQPEKVATLQMISPFAGQVLLFISARRGSLQVLEIADIRLRLEELSDGKYMIALPVPKEGAVVVRADKKAG